MENPTHSLCGIFPHKLCVGKCKIHELKVKRWWVRARERKKKGFLHHLFCPKGILLKTCVLS